MAKKQRKKCTGLVYELLEAPQQLHVYLQGRIAVSSKWRLRRENIILTFLCHGELSNNVSLLAGILVSDSRQSIA